MNFVIVDLETTGREPESAHVVEVAAIAMEAHDLLAPRERAEYVSLVKPPVPIPAETSAVHHIVDSDVVDAPPWADAIGPLRAFCTPETILVAHNSDFERTLLTPVLGAQRWLCTFKAACRTWPDAPGLSNEVLRYYLGHGTGRSQPQQPHSALHDARVTEQLLRDLLAKGNLTDYLAWTEQPALLPTCPLGEWRGKKWSEVDAGFLSWILRKITDRQDVVFCARAELERRAREREAA